MNRTSGNNAIKNSNLCDDVRFEVCGNKNVKTRTVKFTSTKRLRTVKVSPKINEQRIKAERHIQKKMARKRFLKFSVCIVVIGIVAISFIGILSQYANKFEVKIKGDKYGNVIVIDMEDVAYESNDMKIIYILE